MSGRIKNNLIKIFLVFNHLFFKTFLNSRKQINIIASPAKKLKSESSFKLRIEILLDNTARRINVIPMTEISVAGNGFFILLIFKKQDIN